MEKGKTKLNQEGDFSLTSQTVLVGRIGLIQRELDKREDKKLRERREGKK